MLTHIPAILTTIGNPQNPGPPTLFIQLQYLLSFLNDDRADVFNIIQRLKDIWNTSSRNIGSFQILGQLVC
jgi:hypothetical protein